MSRHLLRPKTKRLIHPRPRAGTWQHNGTWTISGTRLTNSPTLGSELLTDTGIEAWTSATNATNYLESAGGTSTVNQETSVVHGGSNAVRFDVDSSNSICQISQTFTTVVGDWVFFSAWFRCSGAGSGQMIAELKAPIITPGATYTQGFGVDRCTTTTTTAGVKRGSAASQSVYADDLSAKKITLNTMYAVKTGPVNPTCIGAQGTIVGLCPAGVVYGMNSISSPTNMIKAMHDGGTNIQLLKMVAGVWTQLITTSATYVSGILPQIKWTGGNTYQLWYNGVQKGTDQTVSDAGSGTLHGVFSTYSGNAIHGFSMDK